MTEQEQLLLRLQSLETEIKSEINDLRRGLLEAINLLQQIRSKVGA